MRLGGASGQAIADCLGVERRTVYLWFSDPLVKEELARQLERSNEAVTDTLVTAGLVGLERLRQLAELPIEGTISPKLKLAAVKEMLDRSLDEQGRLRIPRG